MAEKLYRIKFRHFSQKDSEDGIKELVIASDDRAVMLYVDAQYAYGTWADAEPIDVWDDALEKLIERPYLDKVMRERGNWFEDPCDLYYGFKHWGWSEGVDVTDDEADMLVRLGVAARLDTAAGGDHGE